MPSTRDILPMSSLMSLATSIFTSIAAPSFALSQSLPVAGGPVTNAEGVLSQGHDLSMETLRRKYFYDNQGKLDRSKLESLRAFLTEQRRLAANSAELSKKYNLIDRHGFEDAKASKKGKESLNEEAELLGAFNFAIEHVGALISEGTSNPVKLTPIQIRDKVETTLLFIAAAYTVNRTGVFTALEKQLGNLKENFFDFSLDDSRELQASNLMIGNAGSERFATQADLRSIRERGGDISNINPPSSAIWQNTRVEDYNPEEEVYFGKKMFPSRAETLPVVEFDRMGNGQIKFKVKWKDPSDLKKNGKPKEKNLGLRVGLESYAQPVVTHLARALGYHSIPSVARPKVKMLLGETTWEEFLAMYRHVHSAEMGSPLTYLERVPGENAVIVHGPTLEAYPEDDEYRKMYPFRMGDNGLPNRREYRAMVLYNALIMLKDHGEFQTRVDGYKDPKTSEWQPLYFISDTSSSLGLLEHVGSRSGTVNEFTWRMSKKTDKRLWLFWISYFDPRAWGQTTVSDVKWLARRMARLSSKQIDLIFENSNFPAPAKLLYTERMKSRLNQLMVDLDLVKEGYKPHAVLTMAQIQARYPQYVDEEGFLKEGAQQIPGNTHPILGNKYTISQGLIVGAINAFQSTFLKAFTPSSTIDQGSRTFNLGSVRGATGAIFGADRNVSVNKEVGPNQRRYLLRDRLTVGIPLGIDNQNLTTPVALYYTYSFEYVHSVNTMREVGEKRFFSLLNPFEIRNIRENLAEGERLIVDHNWGASVGTAKVKFYDDLQVEASLLGLSRNSIKSMYFARASKDVLEVIVNAVDNRSFKNGIDVKAIARVALAANSESADRKYKIYRIDKHDKSETARAGLEQAFRSALVDNDLRELDRLSPPRFIDEKTAMSTFRASFLLWHYGTTDSATDLNLNGKRLVLATSSKSTDRAFDRLWTEKLDGGVLKEPSNYVGNFWNEGDLLDFGFEGILNDEGSGFVGGEANISFTRFDNYATRAEYQQNFVNFFNSRSGQKSYIDYLMPKEIDVFTRLIAQMRWQLSFAAIQDIMRAASDWNNTEYLLVAQGGEPRSIEQGSQGDIDPREEVSMRASRFLHGLDPERLNRMSTEERRRATQDLGADAVFVLRKLVGRNAEYLPILRSWTRDERIWVLTKMANVLDRTHSAFRTEQNHENRYFAPEIGKFQGHSTLGQFYRKNLLSPILGD